MAFPGCANSLEIKENPNEFGTNRQKSGQKQQNRRFFH